MADYQVYTDNSDRFHIDCPHCDGTGQVFVCDLCEKEIYFQSCDCEDFTPGHKQTEDCPRCDGTGVIDYREMRDDEY